MYNGWKNYQTWNVVLWINNDEGLYNIAKSTKSYDDFVETIRTLGEVAKKGPWGTIAYETPDNVAWNDSGIDEESINENCFSRE